VTRTPTDATSSDSPRDRAAALFERTSRYLEWPMAILALAVVPALVLETRGSTAEIQEVAYVANWLIWLAFCAEFVIKLWLAPRRLQYVRSAVSDLVIIGLSPPFLPWALLQSVRSIRAVRLLRLLRLVRAAAVLTIGLKAARHTLLHRNFHYVLVFSAGVVGLATIGLWLVEGTTNRGMQSFGDALWLAVATVTTVGYGDVTPVTGEGRVITLVLMFVGIGVVSIFTATVTSSYFKQEKEKETARLETRLDAIEHKLEQLLRRERNI
jgi:voltage-gated potassium channel